MTDDEVSAPSKRVAAKTEGALEGVRIVEFAGIGPAPFAAMLLADMGADVLRIDRPGGSDAWPGQVTNRGRRTVFADLKNFADREGVATLVESADALIEGFRPGVMERLGLGPEALLARNSRLVYGRMTGWGQTGPLAHAAGHDINYIALTGALAAIGPRARPVPPLNLVGDYGGGSLYLVMGLQSGIISARRTGAGQVVDCAICDGAASLMALFTDLQRQGRWSDDRQSNLLDGGAPFYRTYECADGKFVSLGALEPQFYALLRERAGLEDAAFDRDDVAAWPALHAKLEAVFRTRSRDEWCRLLEGSDACFAPVMTLSEAPSHPHLAARKTYVDSGDAIVPAPAPRFSQTPSRIRLVPPEALSIDEALSNWRAG
jgi:alpha-methylacyl-CoA racemase